MKKCFDTIHRILLHIHMNTHAHTKTFFHEVIENSYCEREREVIFIFCNCYFLSLSCSSFWSIIFISLDLF